MTTSTSAQNTEHYSNPHHDMAMRDFPWFERALYNLALAVLWAFSKLMWRWELEDAEKFKLEEGKPRVFICNHTSMPEVIAIVAYLWSKGRHPRGIYKSEFNRFGIVRWAFALVGGIPVERGTADMSALRAAQHALQRGEDILIFPEGTRVRTDDQIAPIHGGFALMAQMGKAPVAPLAVCGFRDITPAGKKLARPVKCWMRAGDMVRFEDAPKDQKRSARTQWVEDEAVKRMFAIRDELRVEHPGRR